MNECTRNESASSHIFPIFAHIYKLNWTKKKRQSYIEQFFSPDKPYKQRDKSRIKNLPRKKQDLCNSSLHKLFSLDFRRGTYFFSQKGKLHFSRNTDTLTHVHSLSRRNPRRDSAEKVELEFFVLLSIFWNYFYIVLYTHFNNKPALYLAGNVIAEVRASLCACRYEHRDISFW